MHQTESNWQKQGAHNHGLSTRINAREEDDSPPAIQCCGARLSPKGKVLGESLANGLLNRALREHAERLRNNRLKNVLKARGGRTKSLRNTVAEVERIMGDTLFMHGIENGRTVKHEKHMLLGLYSSDQKSPIIEISGVAVDGKNPHDFYCVDVGFYLSRHACIRLIQGTHTGIDSAMKEAMKELQAQSVACIAARKRLDQLQLGNLADTSLHTYTSRGLGVWQMAGVPHLKTFMPLTSLSGKKLERLRRLSAPTGQAFLCRGNDEIHQVV